MGLKGIGAERKRKSGKRAVRLENVARESVAAVVSVEERVGKLESTVRELIRASNSASVLLGSIERHLDATTPGWDEGYRAEIEAHAEKMRARAALVNAATEAAGDDDFDDAKRVEIADQIRAVAVELGTAALDAPIVSALYLQVREVGRARAHAAEALETEGLADEVAETLRVLLKRCDEIEADS